MKWTYAFCLGTMLLWLSGCFRTNDSVAVQGPSTETIGLNGSVKTSTGSVIAGARVVVRPENYLMDTVSVVGESLPGGETVTNALGQFSLNGLKAGNYKVTVRSSPTLASMQTCTLTVSGPSEVTLPTAIVNSTGFIRGKINYTGIPNASVYIQVFGLDLIYKLAPKQDTFTVTGIPAGLQQLRVFSSSPALGQSVLPKLLVQSADTAQLGTLTLDAFVNEDYSTWPKSKMLTINFKNIVQSIKGPLLDFPLLIKLDSAQFPFDSVTNFGADIRFAKTSGKHLNYELESWDSKLKQASIWVKLDSLFPSDSQTLNLYYGKVGAQSQSLSSAVFDTGSGYTNVWHLRTTVGKADEIVDATLNQNSMIQKSLQFMENKSSPTLSQASFGEVASIASTKNEEMGLQTFSASIWVRPKAEGKILGFENYPENLTSNSKLFDRHIWVTLDGAVHFGVFDTTTNPNITPTQALQHQKVISAPALLLDGAWHFIAVTQSPQQGQNLFIDGVKVASDTTVVYAEMYVGRWLLGEGFLTSWVPNVTNTHFQGDMAEVRIERIVLSDDWIKLNYESQKPSNQVIQVSM